MDFGTCRECNTYNYLERDGLCQSCLPDDELSYRYIEFDARLSSKPSLEQMKSAAESAQVTQSVTISNTMAADAIDWATADAELRITRNGRVEALYSSPDNASDAEAAIKNLLSKILPTTPQLTKTRVAVERTLDTDNTDVSTLHKKLNAEYSPHLIAQAGDEVVLDRPDIDDINRISVSTDGRIVLYGDARPTLEKAAADAKLFSTLDNILS